MNSEKKQNIDEIINHFIASNNGKSDQPVFNQLIEIKKLELEEQKNQNEQEIKREENIIKAKQNRFPNSILSNPTTTAVVAALAGFLTSSIVAFIQGSSNLELEKLKFQSELIANATKSEDQNKRIELLKFNINAGLIKDQYIISKLESLIQSRDVPQSYVSQLLDPNQSILPNDFYLPTINDFTGYPGCYIAAYSHQKKMSVNSVGGNVYVMGQVRVPGHYEGKNCEPKGYEGKKIDSLDYFKKLFDQKLPKACMNKNCCAGKETGGFVGSN
ncbi:hypothetical protein A6769_28185 [Nostoc punctiforme NIES-2108]|uniref:Uncharacterized protein n=1 Tax=Nostoc punctiforme NIES-2108 TaxID=1356359 RepID=A0A367R929_NOSPU|nr:hypothetical protein A6769_28185 [Nostoc punctiforme NIES-2108]